MKRLPQCIALFLLFTCFAHSQTDGNAQRRDTIIDGKLKVDKRIPSLKDSIDIRSFKDDSLSLALDEFWFKELYSLEAFDSIYNDVSQLNYEEVEYPELSTDTLKARLARLNARTPFNVEYNPSLESVIKRFLKTRRNSLQNLMGLSHFYFPLFETELDKHDIPLEIKYLAIVESALKPKAKSRVGATGLWQFMFTTGKMYNLDVSSYVDERSDPIKSTEAAAKYLSKLYEIFGDWDLALAAYNSGPGNVTKAIRRSGGYENYWNIRHNLPRETAGYLPAFLATMYVFEYAEEHGFKPNKPEFNFFQTDTVHVKQMISFDHIAEVTGLNIETIQFLNPSYKLDIIPKVEGKIYTLELPLEALGVFVANEDAIYAYAKEQFEKREKPLPQFFDNDTKVTYRVKRGDYLGKIARQYSVGVNQIKQWNGLINNNLRVGQRLTIYPRGTPSASKPAPTSSNTSTVTNTAGKKTYTVSQGDSLWSIAQKFPGVSVENIKQWNKMTGNSLKIGTVLVVSQ